MSKPKIYTMFVSFSAMDMEQAIELASMYGGSVIKEVKLNK